MSHAFCTRRHVVSAAAPTAWGQRVADLSHAPLLLPRRSDIFRRQEQPTMRTTLLFGAALACASLPAGLLAQHAPTASERALAHRPVAGRAGPYAHATVVLRRTSDLPDGGFVGTLIIPGGTLPLAGPDEPTDLFLLDVTAVLFTPLQRGGRNGVVVLYNSSQIGPGHGTDRRALAYRVTAGAARRVPAVERRLEGAATAAVVRRRLQGGAR